MTFSIDNKVVHDPKVIKILQKDITKRILDCFNDEPKTASQIANSISFPKDKIYYHIKNLIAFDILYIANKTIVKGIEQKSFFPTAKTFLTDSSDSSIDDININNQVFTQSPIEENIPKTKSFNSNEISNSRKITERRRVVDRRILVRRSVNYIRRKKATNKFSNDMRSGIERRVNSEKRISENRRKLIDRRIKSYSSPLPNFKRPGSSKRTRKKPLPIEFTNTLIKLNGVQDAMTFVQCGDHITYLHCILQYNGFHIKKTSTYELPIRVKGSVIKSLPELVINLFYQSFQEKDKKRIYLAIHSDAYECEMTYLNIPGKSQNLFEKNLYKTLREVYETKKNDIVFDYERHIDSINNATVSFSSNQNKIDSEYSFLNKSGLQVRYITTIPKILQNIYQYYNINDKNEFSLLIYIGRLKTDVVFCSRNQILDSLDFPKGLNFFLNSIQDLNNSNTKKEDKIREALHYLSYYGFEEPSHEPSSNNILYKDAKPILEHVIEGFNTEIKDSIFRFENSFTQKQNSKSIIQKMYIAGPGSHIKGIDLAISNKVKIGTKKLSNIIESHLVNASTSKHFKRSLFQKNNLLRKRDNSEARLTKLKEKISSLEQEIESNQSPESAKYSIARLDIEKSRKIKTVQSANKKLIRTSKEFKSLKKEFEKNQKELHSNLDATKSKLDTHSEILFNQYKEHEEINLRISELDFESDKQKQKKNDIKVTKNINKGKDIKSAAHQRALLNDKKENCETEIDDLETQSIKFHELLKNYGLQLSQGYDEIEELQYLHESLKSISGAFKQSFLEKMKSPESIAKEDILTLQQTGYFITKNTKRVDQIRDSFKAAINNNSSNLKNKFIDEDKGLEVKEKLLKILDLIIKAPEDLIYLKNQSNVILKINNDINKITLDRDKMYDEIKKSKIIKREKQQAIIAVKNNIDVQEKDLKDKESMRLENLSLLNYVRDSMELNDELEHHKNILKELNPRKQLKKKNLREITLKINNLEKAIVKHNQFFENKNKLTNQVLILEQQEEDTLKQISNAEKYINQMEEKCISEKEQSDKIKHELAPIIEESKKRKEELLNDFDKRFRSLETEERLKLAKVKKTRNVTIKIFFKKEEDNLKKELSIHKKYFQEVKKNKEKIISERASVRKSLEKNKKAKLPKIINFKKQISLLEKDLKSGRRLQDRLENLEMKKKEWDTQFHSEQSSRDHSISVLQKTIIRKRSEEYHSFLKTGLDRFDNDGNTEKIATNMVKESVALDVHEIEKIDKSFMRFKKRYDLFMVRYKKNSKEILIKLRPYGGKKKNILKKIRSLTSKMEYEESIIQKWTEKLNKKNESLIQIEGEFYRIKMETENKIKDLNFQIQSIPGKKTRAVDDADRELLQIPKETAKEKASLMLEKEEALHGFDVELANHELTSSLNQVEDKILFYLGEIDQSNTQIKNYKTSIKKINSSKLELELKVEKISKDIKKIKLGHGAFEEVINEENKGDKQTKDSIREEPIELKKKLESFKKMELEIEEDLKKIERDYITSNKAQKDLQKQISDQLKILKIHNSKQSTQIQINERRKKLFQFEKDLKTNVQKLEQVISEMSRFIDSLENDQSELESEINLVDNDNKLFEKDLMRYESLLSDNKSHLNRLSTDYHMTLNIFLKIKSLYPTFKISINERVANLYSIIDVKSKEKDSIEIQLDSANQSLKDRRIEMAMLDKEISNIHNEMKNSLENSMYDSEIEDHSNEWRWEISNSKMKSYMDVAQLKLRAKELFDEIIETEQVIAKMKNDISSMENVLSESEKINLKKIKSMEEKCTKLEIQISQEKTEIDDIKKQVYNLEQIPFNQAHKIEDLKEELKRFKDQESEHELVLRDLDRSMQSIKEKSQQILNTYSNVNANSLSLDYVANLGLLMDPDSKLNLLPKEQKVDLQYFRSNQILQKALLGIVMVLSLGAFANRFEIKPLKDQLPIKKSELSLMTMRKQMEADVENKNSVVDSFKKYIDNDKYVSKSIVSLLQYISEKVPGDFHVTDLKVMNDELNNPDQSVDLGQTNINIEVIGFYNENLDRSLKKAEQLQEALENTGKFKNIFMDKGKKIKNSETQFSIRLIY